MADRAAFNHRATLAALLPALSATHLAVAELSVDANPTSAGFTIAVPGRLDPADLALSRSTPGPVDFGEHTTVRGSASPGDTVADPTPALTLSGSASPALLAHARTGDSIPDFLYDQRTGDFIFILDGYQPRTAAGAPSFIDGFNLTSASGRFIPANVNPNFRTGTGVTTSSTQLQSLFATTPGFSDGMTQFFYDFGNVLPVGVPPVDFLSDLTLKYGVANNGGVFRDSDLFVPEPACLSFLSLAAAGLLGRRRPSRETK